MTSPIGCVGGDWRMGLASGTEGMMKAHWRVALSAIKALQPHLGITPRLW
jgi:hypothetical protein